MSKKNDFDPESPSISKAEWAVMRELWDGGEMTANEVVARLKGKRDWKPKTVHTLIRRLTDKGVLAAERDGREYRFQAVVAERDCQMAESRSFLERVFGGTSLAPLVATFVEERELDETEIAELRRLLARKSKRKP